MFDFYLGNVDYTTVTYLSN